VHRREVLLQDPPVVFAGNIQGRHARETGPKGCVLVSVDAPAGRPQTSGRWTWCAGKLRRRRHRGRERHDLLERFRETLSKRLELNPDVLTVLRVTVEARRPPTTK